MERLPTLEADAPVLVCPVPVRINLGLPSDGTSLQCLCGVLHLRQGYGVEGGLHAMTPALAHPPEIPMCGPTRPPETPLCRLERELVADSVYSLHYSFKE